MVGLTSYSAYVPFHRLSREAIGRGLRGEKAVANFDEDSITMSVAAALDCLNGIDRQRIDGLFFASTTSPYKEKECATTVAVACDLRRDIITADFANTLKSGTAALRSALDAVKAGSAKQVLVTAADCRIGAIGSSFEQNCGDGAAALLIGDSDVAVEVEASHSVSNEMFDVWRADGDTYIRSWEDRFGLSEGYLKVVSEAVSGVLRKCDLTPQDFAKVVFYAPDSRRPVELARNLGFDPRTQLQDHFIDSMGNTGTPYPLMLLVAALEEAKPGERILLASYGNGSDAFVLRATEGIENIRDRRGMKRHLESKRGFADYKTYLRWRGLTTIEEPQSFPLGDISAPPLWREQSRNLSLHGGKCKVCGTIQYPPQRVCTKCHAKDQFEGIRLSDKRGTIVTFAADHVSSPIDTPIVITMINFDGGGRMQCLMTDRVFEEVKVGMPVEMSFRRLFYRDGIYNYFWKSVPVRA